MPDNHLARRAIVAYVPQDEVYLPEMEEVLEALYRKQLLTSWKPYNVEGERDPLQDVDILLLLISPFFAASSFFSQGETDLLRKHEALELCVIPIHLRPTFWYDRPLAALSALPSDGFGVKALTEWKERNRKLVLERVRDGVIQIVEKFEQKQFAGMLESLEAVSNTIERGLSEQMVERGLLE